MVQCPNMECGQQMCFHCKKPVRICNRVTGVICIALFSGSQHMMGYLANNLLSGRRTMILNYKHKDWLLTSMKKE